jgi:hypothetical protein
LHSFQQLGERSHQMACALELFEGEKLAGVMAAVGDEEASK